MSESKMRVFCMKKTQIRGEYTKNRPLLNWSQKVRQKGTIEYRSNVIVGMFYLVSLFLGH